MVSVLDRKHEPQASVSYISHVLSNSVVFYDSIIDRKIENFIYVSSLIAWENPILIWGHNNTWLWLLYL